MLNEKYLNIDESVNLYAGQQFWQVTLSQHQERYHWGQALSQNTNRF